jgi:hypothetical protein
MVFRRASRPGSAPVTVIASSPPLDLSNLVPVRRRAAKLEGAGEMGGAERR